MLISPHSSKSPLQSTRTMQPQALNLIEEINTRQDEALRQIDELNERIEHLIELCVATAKAELNQHNPDVLALTASGSDESDSAEIAAQANDATSTHAEADEQADDESQVNESRRSKAA